MAALLLFEKNIAFCLTTTIFRKIKNATGYHSGTSAAIWSWWSHSETFFSPKRCWVDLHKVWKRSKLVFIVRPVGVSNLGGVVIEKKDPTWWHRSHRRRCHRCRRQSRGKTRPMSNLLMAYRPMLELWTMLIRKTLWNELIYVFFLQFVLIQQWSTFSNSMIWNWNQHPAKRFTLCTL